MPECDKYGSQPPLELLRQWLDHGYWSDLKDTTKVEMVDLVSSIHMQCFNVTLNLVIMHFVIAALFGCNGNARRK